ncbi:MAG TPA: hypothetical protein VMH86_05885 [Rhizomicrobium sp.]|nr:hypothetical protein [Rhizomicrobium sp.]
MSGSGSSSQVTQNYQAFVQQLPELLKTNPGQYALMNNGQIVRFFQSMSDAVQEGFAKYGAGNFSVQQVTDAPILQTQRA